MPISVAAVIRRDVGQAHWHLEQVAVQLPLVIRCCTYAALCSVGLHDCCRQRGIVMAGFVVNPRSSWHKAGNIPLASQNWQISLTLSALNIMQDTSFGSPKLLHEGICLI